MLPTTCFIPPSPRFNLDFKFLQGQRRPARPLDASHKAMPLKSYELSTVLRAHSDDVKCVFPVNSDCILSASRDQTVAVWQREGTSRVRLDSERRGRYAGMLISCSCCCCWLQDFQVKRLLQGHDGYVNSLEFIPADENCQCKSSSRPSFTAVLFTHESNLILLYS